MYKLYAQPVVCAKPDILVPEPRVDPRIRIVARLAGRPYLRQFIGGAKIELSDGGSFLLDSFSHAFKGESRCIAAFLHPNGAEPQILEWFTMFRFNALAKKAGLLSERAFPVKPALRFVHGYEVLRWGGDLARFILPRIGAMPVYHAKFDSPSMERIYAALIEGPYPVAIAPEGQVSYFSDRIPRLEQGVVRIGFTVSERMETHGESGVPVEILPVSVRYRFDDKGARDMENLLRDLETVIGENGKDAPLGDRFLRCHESILRRNEERYGISGGSHNTADFAARVDILIEAALARTEAILNVKTHGDVFARMYRMRQTCWDRIFIAGKTSLNGLPSLDRAALDLGAGEAWYASRHLEVVDFVWYLQNAPVPNAESPLYQRVEYAQNLWDFANRTMGGVFGTRRLIHPSAALITAATPINLRDYYASYRLNRKGTIQEVMNILAARFSKMTGAVLHNSGGGICDSF